MRRITSRDDGVRDLSRLVAASRRMVVFTGAGISTDSGIPDFRSPGGMWDRYRPIPFALFLSSEEMRRESWRRKFATEPTLQSARPNRGHRAVAGLVRQGTVRSVITQNVDGLHQASGVPVEKIIELHGNATYAGCLACGKRFELEALRTSFEKDGLAPRCDACGGHVKTATISFGQPMPPREMTRARAEALSCDLFLVIGSSLVVYPAAGLPLLAKGQGARLAILNRDPTEIDPLADSVFNMEIGPTLGDAFGVH